MATRMYDEFADQRRKIDFRVSAAPAWCLLCAEPGPLQKGLDRWPKAVRLMCPPVGEIEFETSRRPLSAASATPERVVPHQPVFLPSARDKKSWVMVHCRKLRWTCCSSARGGVRTEARTLGPCYGKAHRQACMHDRASCVRPHRHSRLRLASPGDLPANVS